MRNVFANIELAPTQIRTSNFFWIPISYSVHIWFIDMCMCLSIFGQHPAIKFINPYNFVIFWFLNMIFRYLFTFYRNVRESNNLYVISDITNFSHPSPPTHQTTPATYSSVIGAPCSRVCSNAHMSFHWIQLTTRRMRPLAHLSFRMAECVHLPYPPHGPNPDPPSTHKVTCGGRSEGDASRAQGYMRDQ